MPLRLSALLFIALAAIASPAAAQVPPASNPKLVQTVPVWTHKVKLPAPDGRTFISDGGLVLDVEVAKPAVRPSQTMAADMGTAVAGYLSGYYPTEFGLSDLHEGPSPTVFVGPKGFAVSRNYVTFLTRYAPRVRLRLKGDGYPVLLVLDQRNIGLLLPTVLAAR
ncbi:MAG: hypothetical protein ABIT71_24160 [Vicinamibacteraceae bacterium]